MPMNKKLLPHQTSWDLLFCALHGSCFELCGSCFEILLQPNGIWTQPLKGLVGLVITNSLVPTSWNNYIQFFS
jgi:hypothetical protein